VSSVPNLRSAGLPRIVGDSPESNVQRGGSRVIDAVGRVTSRTHDIDQIMHDFRVVPPIRDALRPLEQDGFTLQDVTIVGEVDQEERQVTTLARAAELYYLVQLPAIVAHNETADNRNLIAALDFILPSRSQVYLLIHRVDAIPIIFESFLRAFNRVHARFVPSLWVCGQDGKSMLPLGALLTAFGLQRNPIPAIDPKPDHAPAPDESPQVFSSSPRAAKQEELRLIARNLEALIYRSEGAESSFNDFISRLGLSEEWASHARAQWDRDLNISTSNLVTWADSRGRKMLGRLVMRIVEDAPGRDDAKKILDIAIKCGLIGQKSIESLQRMIDEEMNMS
jgi:hypothetical protein